MAQAIAQIASKRLLVFNGGDPDTDNLIYEATNNVTLQSLWVNNKGTLADTGAGTGDMSSGFDFDAANKAFDINVNGTGSVTIALTATTTTPATVAAEINTQLRAASANDSTTPDTYDRQNPLVEAYVSTDYVGIRCLRNGDSFVLTEDSALSVLGITAGNYDSTDVILWNLVKVVSGGSIGTQADERDIFTNEPISCREGPASVSVGTVLTTGENLYAWVNGDSGTVDGLVCLESGGTSGVA